MTRRVILTVLLLLLVISVPLNMTRAQTGTTVISLAVPDFLKENFSPQLIKDFEAAHPGVTLNLVSQSDTYPSPADDIQKHLDGLQKYVSSADVVYVDASYLTASGTQAGYFLDLSPLIDSDKSFNADDFYPKMWQSFQWDKGIWALPLSATPLVLSYDPDAFDKAGLAYPDAKWTFDDLVKAARALTQKDAQGKTSVYGLGVGPKLNTSAFLAALIDGGVVDNSTVPAAPQLDTPSAENILDTWAKLQSDGIITPQFDQAAMAVVPDVFVAVPPNNPNQKRAAAALPGGKTGLSTDGFALSAGTQHPDLAYALANFLTTRRDAVFDFAAVPARKSVANAPVQIQSGATTKGGLALKLPPDVQSLVDQAMNTGLTIADVRYSDYLDLALQKMQSDHLDAHAALQAAQDQAVKDQKVALAKKGITTIVIPTPAPVAVQPGKITLNFGVDSFIRPFPNQDKWDQLMQQFAASDPQVGKVNMDIGNFDLSEATSKYDCFYMPFNAVPGAKLDGLLSLDPLLSADTTFDKADMVGTTLTQVQVDGKTWALPINVQPSILNYNGDQFSKAGVTLPTNTWTVDSFNDALKALNPDPSNPPFVPTSPGGTHLLLLMAAYGGIPLDYRTNPPTVNLTDPATVQAIRQVLDLAKNGYMKYSAIGGTQMVFLFSGKMDAALITQNLDGFRVNRGGAGGPSPYKPVLYPTRTKYNAISYAVGTAYISSSASNPDACYRWISTLAQHPELFSAMPARHSLINDPTIAAAQGPDLTAAYNQIDALLKDPNTLSFPSMFQAGAPQVGFFIEHWMYQAFDQYVLQNADLDSALKDADNNIKSFQACTSKIAPYDPSSSQTAKEYFQQYLDCAVKVDPQLKPLADSQR